jgi:CubicO group peptidase (beta-lactamase class C family)
LHRKNAGMESRFGALNPILQRRMRDWNVPGLTVGVVTRDRVLFSAAHGFRDPRRGLPVTTRTNFVICSATKAFTATAVGILVDEGKLDWDKPVREYIPSLRMGDPVVSERLTARDLLCHRSGYSGNDAVWITSPASRAQLVERLRYLVPNKDFRTVYQYSNLLYMLVGYLVEQVSGRTWEQFVRERIFAPLGMNESGFGTDDAPPSDDFAVGHHGRARQRVLPYRDSHGRTNFADAVGAVGPAGSIVSNLPDMCRWAQLQLNRGEYREGDRAPARVISEKNLAEVHTPLIPMPDPMPGTDERMNASQAMGWAVSAYRGYRMISHSGNFGGFISNVSFLPGESLGIVLLTNSDYSSLDQVIPLTIYDWLLGLHEVGWNKRWKRMFDQWNAAVKAGSAIRPRKRGTRPSHPLSHYAGDYEHPAYDRLRVSKNKGRLEITYNRFLFHVKHHHYDIFRMDPDRRNFRSLGTMYAAFHMNKTGDIDSISVPLEPPVGDIVFKKISSGKDRVPGS